MRTAAPVALGNCQGDRPFALRTLEQDRSHRKAPAVIERTTRKTVSFLHPFQLAAVEGEQPAGSYTIETIEEPLGGLSFLAHRRVSTTIVLVSRQFGAEARQVVTIDPLDLEAAQERDAAKAALPSGT